METNFSDEFSKEIYEQTYKINPDTCIGDTLDRVAGALADLESDRDLWFDKFRSVLHGFKFVPGGRVISNAGTGIGGTSLINCFTSGPSPEDGPVDSMEGILSELRRQALTLKSEGGYGFCCDFMRPRGAFVEGIAAESPGTVSMLDMWDTQSAVITKGSGQKSTNKKAKGKIRKGAQMVTMSCWHPAMEEFVTAKRTPGKLTKFNMSVLITDDFMNAVKNNLPWDLVFPDLDEDKVTYDADWDGNINRWIAEGGSVKVYKSYSNANELWDLIMDSTYKFNDPGVLFVDTINKMDNLDEYISTTNPCGEQPMSPHSICLLGSLNLTQFINNDRTDFDYDAITEAVPTIIRLMDNVNDIAYVPLPEQRESLAGKRRVGLGYMGYGSALMLLGVKYGSERALEITAKLCSHVANLAYQSSAKLAREKGPFPMQDLRRYLKSEFLKGLSPETLSMIKKYGTRNSHLLSVQPTGNTAIVANNVSGGLEPLFLPEYIRTVIVNSPPRGLKVPSSIDWSNNIDSLGEWNWTKEGDESLLRREMRGVVYKIDRNRGLTKEQLVCDYAVRILKEEDSWNPEADWAQTTTQLSVDDHVSTMAIFAKYCDAAISKTINVSNDTTYEDFKEIYMKAFDTGFVKGFTTYRAGTRTSVLAAVGENSQDDSTEDHIVVTKAPKRPKKLPCDIFSIASNNKKWTIIVGLLNGQPYEIFALESKELGLDKDISSGVLWKTSKKKYNLELDGEIVRDLQKFFKTDEQESITRLLSTSLRHGTPLTYLVSQMRKSGGTVVAYSKAIARVLSKYVKVSQEGSKEKCPSCGSDKYFFVEGCNKCSDCGYGACS
jgi:ribonucleoside-diphosphate reductase alpha chain